MRPSHLLAIFVRMAAILLVLSAVRQLPFIFHTFFDSMPTSILFSASVISIELLLAIILWKFPLSIASGIIKPELDQEINVPAIQGMLCTMIIILGLYVTCYALVDVAYWVSIRQSYSSYMDDGSFRMNPEVNANLLATGVELAIGLVLIFKSKTIAKFLFKASS